eukprot:COSAG02_NODE_3829_length_6176_cov_26.434096_5_plen_512_part_00
MGEAIRAFALLVVVAHASSAATQMGSLPPELMTEQQLSQLRASPHTGTSFDCKVREYAYEFAQKLQGWRGGGKMRAVYDSLQLTTLCNQTFETTRFQPTPRAHTHRRLDEAALRAFVVDASSRTGQRSKPPALGDQSAPFSTVHEALMAVRVARRHAMSRRPAMIVLREGTHYSPGLELGPEDSQLAFVNYPGELAAMSGAITLTTDWKPYRRPAYPEQAASASSDIWVADLSKQHLHSIPGLRINGARGVRASFPNRNPERSIFPDGWIADNSARWTPPVPPARNETHVTVASPSLHDKTMFQNFMVGVGGHCERYSPPVSYWCGAAPSGGCFGGCFQSFPSGLTYSKFKRWKDPTRGGILTAWRPNHWANWMFEIDQWNSTTKTVGWTKGGFQGARGNRVGAEFFVENVFEELDSPNEYWYDEETQLLYYIPNRTLATTDSATTAHLGPPVGNFEAVVNHTLVKLTGTKDRPVEDVNFEGIVFKDSAYTYMEDHGVPSGPTLTCNLRHT